MTLYLFEPGHNISYKTACAPSENGYQPARPRRLIIVLITPDDALDSWLLRECPAKTLISLCLAHMQSCRKCCAPVHLFYSGPSCSKLTMSLANVLLKLWSLNIALYANIFAEKTI